MPKIGSTTNKFFNWYKSLSYSLDSPCRTCRLKATVTNLKDRTVCPLRRVPRMLALSWGELPWRTILAPKGCNWYGVKRIVIFPANGNRNRFAEPTSVQIGIGIVCEFQNLRIGKGIIFDRWEEFANYLQIPENLFFFQFF